MHTKAQKYFWTNLLKAAEAEPKDANNIRGASGIQYPAVAIGVDEGRRRVLIVSGEHDARTAAMAQVDIQAALENMHVLVARPIALDFTLLAKTAVGLLGRTTVSSEDLVKLSKPEEIGAFASESLKTILAPLEYVGDIPMNVLAQWMYAIQQLGLINFSMSSEASTGGTQQKFVIDLRQLAEIDPLERDNHYGICPVPLYQFQAAEVETLNSGANLDDVREVLRQHHLIQYFFPAPDQLALGLVDLGARSPKTLLDQLLLSPEMGHPFSDTELIENQNSLPAVIEALQERDLVIEGELGLEVGPGGRQVRALLKFKPREGLLSKIINKFSFSIDLKNLIGLK